jgi:hypothetical protein
MGGDFSTPQNLSGCTPICNSKLYVGPPGGLSPLATGKICGLPVQKLAEARLTGETGASLNSAFVFPKRNRTLETE